MFFDSLARRNHLVNRSFPVRSILHALIGLPLFALLGCGTVDGGGLCEDDTSDMKRPDNWVRESHCPGEEPAYDNVFDTAVVHRIDIVVSASDYAASYANLDAIEAETASVADYDELSSPAYFPATVTYGGRVWNDVGMRWKGHASLMGAYRNGVKKLSFALNFDRFEDVKSEVFGQRFWGFNKLSFSNGYNDPSLLRDKTAADIFRNAGVPAARSSFAAVYIDVGDGLGPTYHGLYTIIEDPADKMMKTQLGDGAGGGNLYKPFGDPARWASLAEYGAPQIQQYFEKQTNEEASDWSDVIAAITALHADRTVDPSTWRANFEAVFNVSAFLKALAVNQVIGNWDAYGCMHHNYLLYGNPLDNNRLLWMPWDLNEALLEKTSAGCPPAGSVLLDEITYGDPADPNNTVDTNWPLVRFLLADPVYRPEYLQALQAVLDTAFNVADLTAKIQADHDLVSPWVLGPTATETGRYQAAGGFDVSLVNPRSGGLFEYLANRRAAVETALSAAAANTE